MVAIELLAFCGLAVYVCQTIRTNNLTQEALRLTKRQFIQEQRPYIWLMNALGSPRFILNGNNPSSDAGQVVWDYHFTNYGKTPAIDIDLQQFIKLGDGPFVKSYGNYSSNKGAPLPPTKDDWDTVISELGIPANRFSELLKAEIPNGISIKAVFHYADLAGGKYETGFCLNRLNSGAIGYCREGNYVK